MLTIAIGCDHIVTPIKNKVIEHLLQKGYKVIDCGTYNDIRTHYPIYGYEVAKLVTNKEADLGVVICGTGVGITNSANKVYGARVCLTRDVASAIAAKKYYNANIIGCGGRISGLGLIEEIVDKFIQTKYDNSHKNDLHKINHAIKHKNYDIKFDHELKKWEIGGYCDGIKQEKVPMPKNILKGKECNKK